MKELIEGFKNLSRISARVAKLIENYAQLKENSEVNAYLMEKGLREIQEIAVTLPDFTLKNQLGGWINEEKEKIEKAKEEFRFQLGEKIKRLFQNEGMVVHGQFPKLRVGFYTILLDFEFGEAKIFFGPEIERIKSKVPLEPETIYRTIKKFDGVLKKTKFEPNEFYQDLRRAYDNCLRLAKKAPGERIYLMEVLNQYVLLKQPAQFFVDPRKENFREFSRITLAYLLYLFKKSEPVREDVHLYIANLDATTDKKRAIWIPDNEKGEGTYYSYIAFSEK
ncbi:MAG: hypothetical protein ABIL40_05690 [candidate division WOR-3 bacterium]